MRALHHRLAQQLGQVLYERLGLKGGRKGKSGQYSTDVNELERLAAEGVSCATLVLEWRQLTKLKSTYTDALQTQINADTGRVHTSFSLTGAQTGRLSSNDPNLQNIPIRTEIGRKIRDAFVADAGHKILSADYSQIELRLAAHMADVPQLKDAFRAGADIHAITAQELFGHVDRDTRNQAKTINFAILYGSSAWGIAGRLGLPKDEGKAIIDRYYERFPGIRAFFSQHFGVRSRAWLHQNPVRAEDPLRAQHPFAQSVDPRRRRAGRDQRSDPGHQRRPHQARDGADGRRARRRRPRRCPNAPAGP